VGDELVARLATGVETEEALVRAIREAPGLEDATRSRALEIAGAYWLRWTTELATAKQTVDQMFRGLLLKDLVIENLQRNGNLSDAARKRALEWAGELREDPDALNEHSFQISMVVGQLPESSFQQSLRYIQRALELKRNNPYYLLTLGATQYRLARYDEALATAERAQAEISKLIAGADHPTAQALLAMIHHKLGHAKEAKACLSKAQVLIQKEGWRDDRKAHATVSAATFELANPSSPKEAGTP
jgi:tetratricopeptide (TPR) repeat protein